MGIFPATVRLTPGALLRPAVAAWFAGALLRMANQRDTRLGIALVWHGISPSPREPRTAVVREHDTTVFREQLAVLRRFFEVVPVSELVEATGARRAGDPFPVALTFDDDLSSHVEVAAPLLRDAGLPATFFLCGRSIDGPYRFWWERLQDALDRGLLDDPGLRVRLLGLEGGTTPNGEVLARAAQALDANALSRLHERLEMQLGPDPVDSGLSAEQIRRLVDLGFELGFHTRNHPRLTEMSGDGLAAALSEGRDRVDRIANGRISLLAYPYGAADSRVAQAASRAGYSHAFTGTPTPITPPDERLLLGRVVPSFRSGGHLALQLGLVFWRGSWSSQAG